MITVKPYEPSDKDRWNQFSLTATNATFLLHRDFLEYHRHRFNDYSLLFFDKETLIALFPASQNEFCLQSHGGLSYGGLIYHGRLSFAKVLACYQGLILHCKEQQFAQLEIKPVPTYYHSQSLFTETYILQQLAKQVEMELNTVIDLKEPLLWQKRRKRGVTKAKKNGVRVVKATTAQLWEEYWKILQNNLEKSFHTKPVHTIEEMLYLVKKFPEEIQLFLGVDDDTVLAGMVLFKTKTTVHAQYIAASEKGKAKSALDLVIHSIQERFSASHAYLSLGVSNTRNDPDVINQTLLAWKEGFGGRTWIHTNYYIHLEELPERLVI